jgi:actin-related protein
MPTPKVIASLHRRFSSWIGGSISASLSTFDYKWITREQYDEYGAEALCQFSPDRSASEIPFREEE